MWAGQAASLLSHAATCDWGLRRLPRRPPTTPEICCRLHGCWARLLQLAQAEGGGAASRALPTPHHNQSQSADAHAPALLDDGAAACCCRAMLLY
jgi:hypothetical protein